MTLLRYLFLVLTFIVIGKQLIAWRTPHSTPTASQTPIPASEPVTPSVLASQALPATPSEIEPETALPLREPLPFQAWPQIQLLSVPRDLRILILEDNEEKKQWSYQSEHFTFHSNAPLRDHVIREFASLFELTHLYCRQIPLPFTRLTETEPARLRIELVERYPNYLARGGTPESGGVYLANQDLILVPFQALGLRNGINGYSLDPIRNNRTLIHEVTHMLMSGPLLQAGWFIEGSAEYVATIPLKANRLTPSDHIPAILSYITAFGKDQGGGYNLGTSILLPSLQELMESDYESFRKLPNAYPASLFLFHYLAHSHEQGDASALCQYARDLNQGLDEKTARKHLLAGRNYQTIEKLLTNSWEQHGIALRFNN